MDVNYDTGGLKKNFPELDVSALKETCALDVADAGGITLEEVGSKLGLTRERVRQIEHNALTRLHKYLPRAGVDDD